MLTFTALAMPLSSREVGPSVAFVPAMLAVVCCFDLLTVYLLAGDYLDRGEPRSLMTAWAYAFSLALMAAYALAFPGVLTAMPLASCPSTAPWLYVAWHGGFPAMLGLAWAPWPARWVLPHLEARRGSFAGISLVAVALGGCAFAAALVFLAPHLPPLIHGLDTSAMTLITAPIAMPVAVISLVVIERGTRSYTGPERWCAVAALVCTCDLTLTYWSATRFSFGWYCGRTLTLLSAAIVLMASLAQLRRMKVRAERDAMLDALTGLYNRRGATLALDRQIARCQRSGAALSVLCLDLDHFKRINDSHGHDGGDAVLREVSRALVASCRSSDLVARMGGEEFLVLLPEANPAGLAVIAEKIRVVVAQLAIAPVGIRCTISIGAACLSASDENAASLLRRADEALYEAKRNGRNRVVAARVSAFASASGIQSRRAANAPSH